MELTVLGMNGPFPAAGGCCSGYLLNCGSTHIQLDLGTGVLAALTARMAPEQLDALVLSHWHNDHASDVLPLIYRMESMLQKGCEPLTVYAPADERSPIRAAAMQTPALRLVDVTPGDVLNIGGTVMQTYAARHPVPAMMLRITDGTKVFAFTGDTNTTEALPLLARDADLLLADGLFPEALWAENKPHLSAKKCAELAASSGTKHLVITHLNPEIDPAALLREAREIYPRVVLARQGMICAL